MGNGDLRFARHLIELFRKPPISRRGVRQLLGRRNDGKAQPHECLELRHHDLERRGCAKYRDVGFGRLRGLAHILGDLHPDRTAQLRHSADITANLAWVDIDCGHDTKAFAGRKLTRNCGADGSKSDVHHANRHMCDW
jgi:hypothetical protein